MSDLQEYYLNFHNHQSLPGLNDTISIFNPLSGIDSFPSHQHYSFGQHPWFLNKDANKTDWEWLTLHNDKLIAIGECGLDKNIDLPLSSQITIFQRHIRLSETIQKPLIIHCVRAYNELISIYKKEKPQQKWIVHGFERKTTILKMLSEAGIYCSFGAGILKENSAASTSFKTIDDSLFFLETDDKNVNLGDIYRRAAFLKNKSLSEIKLQIWENFKTVFGDEQLARTRRIISRNI